MSLNVSVTSENYSKPNRESIENVKLQKNDLERDWINPKA